MSIFADMRRHFLLEACDVCIRPPLIIYWTFKASSCFPQSHTANNGDGLRAQDHCHHALWENKVTY